MRLGEEGVTIHCWESARRSSGSGRVKRSAVGIIEKSLRSGQVEN